MNAMVNLSPFQRVGLVFAAVACLAVAAWAQEPYRLGPEDVVAVQVLNHPEFSGEFIVPSTGSVSLPVVGDTKMSGRTLEEVRMTVLEGLKKRLLRPEVNVFLKLPRPKRVYVYGEVQKPGIVPLAPGWRVQEALGAAGGLVPGTQTSDVRVIIERADKTKAEYTLGEVLSRPIDQPLTVGENDVLRFQTKAQVPVYVAGQVKSPALYRLREGEAGVLEAITQAGGATTEANLTDVRVIHLNGKEEHVNLAPSILRGEPLRVQLQPGDMVLVAQATERIAVLGYVTRPGLYAIPSGQELTLSQAIALSGGNTARARMSRVGLIRMENGKETRVIYDLGKFLRDGDARFNPVLRPNDVVFVPETNKFDLNSLLGPASVVRLIFGN
jgi:polysaccharide export outer membrane protein